MKTLILKSVSMKSMVLIWSSLFSQTINDTSVKRRLTIDEFEIKAKEPNVQIIDIRIPEVYNSGYLKGAMNIDYNAKDFEKHIQTLSKSKTYLLYCLGGTRNAKAADIMKQNGFQNVYDLMGGIMK